MGIFGDQAERLLRESWSDTDELAQELYAMFTDTAPLQIDSPVKISTPQGSTVPPLTLENNGISPAAISFSHLPVPSVSFGSLPEVAPLPPNTITNIYGDGSGETWAAPGELPATTPGTGTAIGGGGGGGGVIGKVLSGGPGTGPYKLQVFPTGLKGKPLTVNATQLSIASDASIPPGTWTILTVVSTTYYMQCPVWGPSS